MNIYPYNFCPDLQFENKIVSVLHDLFYPALTALPGTVSAINNLHHIYDDMRMHCDHPDIEKKYMVDGNCIKVNTKGLEFNNFVYAGVDLPVWINTPNTNVDEADLRVMIVGRDPGRKPIDMYETQPKCHQITICSPFGMHCRYHRRKTTAIPGIVSAILNTATRCNKSVSVYITDFYKFRATNGTSTDNDNKGIYKEVYNNELRSFDPHLIVLLGKSVMKAIDPLKKVSNGDYFTNCKLGHKRTILIPHPSMSNNREIKNVTQKTGKEAIDCIINQISKIIEEICSINIS